MIILRVTKKTLHNLIDGMQDSDSDLAEVANFIGYLKMKRDNELSFSENFAYEVTDLEEEELLLNALNGDNPALTEEEINKMLGQ